MQSDWALIAQHPLTPTTSPAPFSSPLNTKDTQLLFLEEQDTPSNQAHDQKVQKAGQRGF